MSIHIYFSNNSIRNTTLSCDSLGIHYTVSRSRGVTSVTRWDSATNSNVRVGEFKLHLFRKDIICIGENGQWRPLTDVMYRRPGRLLSTARSFEASDGVTYRWKTRWARLVLTHDSDHPNKEALITYTRNQFSRDPAYLEVSDSSVLAGLDAIIVTFLIHEKKRRDRQKSRQRGASGGGP